jgi:4-hydroxy-4-methyl-2-oxoglutarate aldolase
MNRDTNREKRSIIDYIKRNRVSSTEVADCLGKIGAIERVCALNRGHFKVGNVFWAFAYGGSNWSLHEQIQDVQENDVVFVEAIECGERAVFGDLVSKYLMLYRQASAIIVKGNMRDIPRLIKENWPIWCQGYNPIGCINDKLPKDFNESLLKTQKQRYHGAIAVCDDTGAVIIPKECHNRVFLKKLEAIEAQEDAWYDAIDRKKMSTFEAVCLRRYLGKTR